MRHCPYYMKTLNRIDIPVKKQHLHKVFLSTRMLPNKILTNSPFVHSGTKITRPVWKYIFGPKIKNTPPIYLKGTKGKQSIQRKTITKHFQRNRQRKITRLGLQQEFCTHMYVNLRKQSDDLSKIRKHIKKSQVINEHKFPCG
jgi:hypothetical protein